jgi:hypothetical protein
MIKINAMIEEMNYRIAENRAVFREELLRLKSDFIEEPNSVETIKKKIKKRDLSIPVFPRKNIVVKNHDS